MANGVIQMNVQILPELLLLVKMHDEMDGRNGLLKNGSQSGLCERTEVWMVCTSIINSQFNCIHLPCLLPNTSHVNDISKLFSIPSFPLIIIYHFPEPSLMKEQVV